MSRTEIRDLSEDQTLDDTTLQRVRGGLIGLLLPAVQKVGAVGDPTGLLPAVQVGDPTGLLPAVQKVRGL